MCAVSVLLGYMIEHVPVRIWTQEDFDYFRKVVRDVEALDKRLGQPDCTDPQKEAYLNEVEEHLHCGEGS